jgi:hypothetical protein
MKDDVYIRIRRSMLVVVLEHLRRWGAKDLVRRIMEAL